MFNENQQLVTISGHSDLTKMSQWREDGWFNGISQPVCTPPNNTSLAPPESTTQMASRLVRPFLHSSWQNVARHVRSLKIAPSHWGSVPSNTIPLAHLSPKPKRHLDWFSRFFTAHCSVFLYFTMGYPLPPQNCPFPWRDLGPHLIHGLLGQPKSSTEMASLSVEPFL